MHCGKKRCFTFVGPNSAFRKCGAAKCSPAACAGGGNKSQHRSTSAFAHVLQSRAIAGLLATAFSATAAAAAAAVLPARRARLSALVLPSPLLTVTPLSPYTVLLGGWWSAMTAPKRLPQWWQP